MRTPFAHAPVAPEAAADFSRLRREAARARATRRAAEEAVEQLERDQD
jgi:hypothetical protein